MLCSGNGVYEGGICKCYNNWKGAECSIQAHHCKECIHGRCIDGECSCQVGWKGEDCGEVDCEVPHCSGHGVCQSGNYCTIKIKIQVLTMPLYLVNHEKNIVANVYKFSFKIMYNLRW